MNARIESVFGRKAALCLVSTNWKHKEQAIKMIYKQSEKTLGKNENV